MYRSLLPFIFAFVGFAVVALFTSMPLFEWQISELTADFPAAYQVVAAPSPWTARLGDSLNSSSYVLRNVYVSTNGEKCFQEDLDISVNSSASDKSFDQIGQSVYKSMSWLYGWSWLEILLSIGYIVWFALWAKEIKAFHAVVVMGGAVISFFTLIQILRIVAPFPYSYYFGTADCDHGTITLSIMLSKIHYETLTLILAGFVMEIGALVTMIIQIRRVIVNKRSSLSAV